MIGDIINKYGLVIIIVETLAIVVLLVWLWLSDDNSEALENKQEEIEHLQLQLDSKNRTLNKANSELKQWRTWYEQNKHLLIVQEQKASVTEIDTSKKIEQRDNTVQAQYQYLQEANDGKFMRLLSSPEKCYFRTWEEGGVRKYEFCGNVARALANINAIFDDVCEIEGKRSGAIDIVNVSAGTLDSELRIRTKAIIRLK